jgi:hypothetical protein
MVHTHIDHVSTLEDERGHHAQVRRFIADMMLLIRMSDDDMELKKGGSELKTPINGAQKHD